MTKRTLVLGLGGLYLLGLALTGSLNLKTVYAYEPVSSPISLYIRGKIRLATLPLSGVKVQLYSTYRKDTLVSETYTNDDGSYEFTSLVPNSYKVQPNDKRYKFSPLRYLLKLIASVDNLDFTAVKK